MRRIDLYLYYWLGGVASPLADVSGEMESIDLNLALKQGRLALRSLAGSLDVPLSYCRTSLDSLLEKLDEAIDVLEIAFREDRYTDILPEDQMEDIRSQYEKFVTLLRAELARKNTYAVVDKTIYSTEKLIESGEHILPDHILALVPSQCRDELNQAGRCLAFELPTACAFHVMRALEVLILEYWDTITNQPRPENRNWGMLLREIDKQGGDKSVIAAINHVKDLHRNPIMHPEITLTMEEAAVLWGAAPSTMAAVVKDIEKRRKVVPLRPPFADVVQ